MRDLIDRAALREEVESQHPGYALSKEEEGRCNAIREVLETIDAAPTLRCDECKHENEGVASSCLANVAVFPDENSLDYDAPPPDFACSEWEAK